MLLCSASLPEEVIVPLRFNWQRWQLYNNEYNIMQLEPGYSTVSVVNRTTNQSILIMDLTSSGEYCYECQVQLDRDNLEAASRRETITITVTSELSSACMPNITII